LVMLSYGYFRDVPIPIQDTCFVTMENRPHDFLFSSLFVSVTDTA
jgi:hypothetical protein